MTICPLHGATMPNGICHECQSMDNNVRRIWLEILDIKQSLFCISAAIASIANEKTK